MKLPSIKDIDVFGKRVFLRSDLDVPLQASSQIEDDTRLKAGLPTIQYLLDQEATVFVAGKLGRPVGVDKKLSLEPVAKWLADKLNSTDHYNNTYHCSGTTVGEFPGWKLSDNLYVLENLRFYDGEEANDPQFSQKLARLADIYVNDSFAVSHRNHASIVGVANLLPHYAGLQLAKEVEVLSGILDNPKRPLVVIIGGAKVETKLPLIEKMLSHADYVLVGGKLPMEESLKQRMDEKLIVAQLTPDTTDITGESIAKFAEIIHRAQTVVWNGPLGLVKDDAIDTERGTREVANTIAQSGAYKIVGGGDTLGYLQKLGIVDQFDFVSTGGGAMLAFLSGETLPGLEVLSG